MDVSSWQVYIALGLLLIAAEIVAPGFVIACFGLGCLAAAAVAAVTDDFTWHLAGFAAGTFLAFVAVRPAFNRPRADTLKTNADAYAGRRARVIERIGAGTAGKVKVTGEIWQAVASCEIPEGEEVVVERIDGLRLHVRRAETASKEGSSCS